MLWPLTAHCMEAVEAIKPLEAWFSCILSTFLRRPHTKSDWRRVMYIELIFRYDQHILCSTYMAEERGSTSEPTQPGKNDSMAKVFETVAVL